MSADAMKKEQENFWRVLRIMWDDVPTRLCALFKQKFRTRFRESWKDEKEGKAAQKTFIEQIKTNSSVDQQTIRKIEKGDTKCFDCTALFMCLLYSGTEIMKPTRQEKAYPYRDSERVDELRVMRNTVAHAKTTKTMSVSTFNNNITSLTDIYKQLHWDTTEMLQLAQKPVVTEECNRLKKLLDDEMERFRALDLIVQDHAQKLKTLSAVVEQHDCDINELKQEWELRAQATSLSKVEQQPIIDQQKQLDDQVTELEKGTPTSKELIEDELQKLKRQLKDIHNHTIATYLRNKGDDEETTFKDLNDIFIELHVHDAREHYKRLEKRSNIDDLQLEEEVSRCPPIEIKDLFSLDSEKKVLVTGKAGTGKTVLTMHLLDLWLKGQLPGFDYLFFFPMHELSHLGKCSLSDLLFMQQGVQAPSSATIEKILHDPRTLVVLDSLDEFCDYDRKSQCKAISHMEKVEISQLIGSVICGKTMKPARLLVTSHPGAVKEDKVFDQKAEIYGFREPIIFKYVSKFSEGNDTLKTSITNYIKTNINIRSFCYVPAFCNLVCRIAKMKLKQNSEAPLPTTLTQLLTECVLYYVIEHHPQFKNEELHEDVDVIAQIKDPLRRHSKLAKDGISQKPIKDAFSKADIARFGLSQVTTTQETATRDMVTQEMATRDMATQETATQETTTQETATQDMATQEMATQETATQDMATQETATQETATQETATLDMATQETATQETTTQETATQEAATQEAATQDMATQETATQETATQDMATQCGFLTVSREKPKGSLSSKLSTQIYYFSNLIMQEFLASIALVSNIKETETLLRKTPNEGQLDMVLAFVSGLVGDPENKGFLKSLGCQTIVTARDLLRLVVTQERDQGRHDHKSSILLLLMLVYESSQPGLWGEIKDFVLKDGKELNLKGKHIGPDDEQALAFVMPKWEDVNNLDLTGCNIHGTHLIAALGDLTQLTHLSLEENPNLHDTAVMTTLNLSLKKLTKLKVLCMNVCELNDDDIIILSEVLPSLKRLEELMFCSNSISDSGSKRLAEVAVTLPCFRKLWLWGNCLTEQGVESVRQVERVESDKRDPPRSVWLVWLDWQRLPEQELNPSNPVVFLEHRETQQHSALNRLLRRDKKEQDKWWDTDVKYLKGALQKSRSELQKLRQQ